MKTTKILTIVVVALSLILCQTELSMAEPMGTAFTYQGHLYDANYAANGPYDFALKLYDANVGGSKVGTDVNVADVDVIDALFTAELDFGSGVFDGNACWLEIGIRPGDQSDPCAYTVLSPRQEITPAPYALYAAMAGGSGSGADFDWTISGNNMYSAVSGNVGIGTTSPTNKLEVTASKSSDGILKVTNTSSGGYSHGILAYSGSGSNSWGIYGEGEGSGGGVCGIGNGWHGVYGECRHDYDNHSAIYGYNTAGGYAGYFDGQVHVTGNLSCDGTITGTVDNADKLDGQHGSYYRDWNNLTNVPAGFADGIDDVGGNGDITAVYADNGLTGGATSGDAHLNVGAGDGIDVSTNTVAVDVTDFAGNGLGESSNDLKVNTSTGLEISSDAVRLTSAYSSGSAYDSRFVNDNAGEVDGSDIALGTTISGSTTYEAFGVSNTYAGTTSSHGIVAESVNYSNDWYHWGVEGTAGSNHMIVGGMRHAGVFGGGESGYSYLHGVIGVSWDGRGVWGGSANGYAGYFSGDLHVTGDITAGGSKAGWVVDVCYNADITELKAGDVVVLSGEATQEMMYGTTPIPVVKKCNSAADTRVLGVVVSRKKITPFKLEEKVYKNESDADNAPVERLSEPLRETEAEAALDPSIVPPGWGCNVAILGAVEKCKVDASHGSIEVGDLLTTSPTPGHAMKASNPQIGTIIGKALEPLSDGIGVIKITVTLR